MDSIYTLLTYIFNITLIGGFFMFCFKCMEFRKHAQAKNFIQSLNARLSILRMNLKGKVKKKSYKYRSLFKNGVSPGDPIDLVLNEMIDLKLETGEEIEKYFELSKRINSLLITANARQPEKQTEKLDKVPDKSDKTVPLEKVKIPLQIEEKMDQEAFMGTDFKSEISIIRIIKDMVEVSVVLSHRIEAYNALNPKSPIENVSQLTFPSLSEVNRIFKSEQKKLGEDVSEAA